MPDGGSIAWHGGRVFTGSRYAEALLISDGRVEQVGTDDEVRRETPAGVERRDLAGRVIVPGLIDPHLHWVESTLARTGVNLRGSRSLEEIHERVGRVRAQGAARPMVGSGWDQELLAEHRFPTRSDLDRMEPDRPLVLFRICQHVAVANSSALDAMHVDPSTPSPAGGRVDRDSGGEPTGVLVDNALRLVEPITEAAFQSDAPAALAFLSALAARGLTAIGTMRVRSAELAVMGQAATVGGLPLGIRAYVGPELLSEISRSNERLRGSSAHVAGIKLVLDGALGPRTAWLEAPYADRSEESGLSLLPKEQAIPILRAAADDHLQVALHAIGDRALRQAIELAERTEATVRIEHASVVPPLLEERLVHLRAPVVIQPGFLASDTWLEARLGRERAAWAYPFRRLLELGVPLAASSDAPVESYDPWEGLRILTDSVGLAPEAALYLYTGAAAAALGEPARGELRPGSPADLVVLNAHDVGAAIRTHGPVAAVFHAGRPVAPEGAK
ncbi:MAG TPA: amidohydrolase [Thermoplasmata archaeon]|nr:amidohydrolase [Thermoplasmata archaeon]